MDVRLPYLTSHPLVLCLAGVCAMHACTHERTTPDPHHHHHNNNHKKQGGPSRSRAWAGGGPPCPMTAGRKSAYATNAGVVIVCVCVCRVMRDYSVCVLVYVCVVFMRVRWILCDVKRLFILIRACIDPSLLSSENPPPNPEPNVYTLDTHTSSGGRTTSRPILRGKTGTGATSWCSSAWGCLRRRTR